jgi:hypothetical protein
MEVLIEYWEQEMARIIRSCLAKKSKNRHAKSLLGKINGIDWKRRDKIIADFIHR